jgi:hypothetical protein
LTLPGVELSPIAPSFVLGAPPQSASDVTPLPFLVNVTLKSPRSATKRTFSRLAPEK